MEYTVEYIDPVYRAENVRTIADFYQTNTQDGLLNAILRDIHQEAQRGKYFLRVTDSELGSHTDFVITTLASLGYGCNRFATADSAAFVLLVAW